MVIKILVQIVSAPGCSKCAGAQEVIKSYAKDMKNVSVKEVNIAENPELAVKHGIMSTPAVIVNGKLAFSSAPKLEEFKKYINKIKNGS